MMLVNPIMFKANLLEKLFFTVHVTEILHSLKQIGILAL